MKRGINENKIQSTGSIGVIKRIFISFLFIFASASYVNAGVGWYISVANFTNEPFTVNNSGNTCWTCAGVCDDTLVEPNTIVQIYTTTINSGA